MTLSPNDLLSLDTNVLVHWIRQNDTGTQLRDTYRLHEAQIGPFTQVLLKASCGRSRRFGIGEPQSWRRSTNCSQNSFALTRACQILCGCTLKSTQRIKRALMALAGMTCGSLQPRRRLVLYC